jgi:hypothetical protein
MTLGRALDLIEAQIQIPRQMEDRLVSFILRECASVRGSR